MRKASKQQSMFLFNRKCQLLIYTIFQILLAYTLSKTEREFIQGEIFNKKQGNVISDQWDRESLLVVD